MFKFRSQRHVHRQLVLFFIATFSLLAQWSRWLPVYLSAVRLKECGEEGVCKGLSFEPLCRGCDQYDEACLLCNTCRSDYESYRYNFQDGVCMDGKQYGLITGFGFSLTFSLFGLMAGFFVDVTSERGSTVLGVSALLGGVISILYSFCTKFDEVLVLRAVLGALQAFGAPASVQMICTHFKRSSDRPIANAAYTVGLYVGAGLSSLSTLVAERYGWHAAFRIVGLSGIIVAIIFELTVDLRFTSLCPTGPRGDNTGIRPVVGNRVSDDAAIPVSMSQRDERCPLLSGAAGTEDKREKARKITVTGSHSARSGHTLTPIPESSMLVGSTRGRRYDRNPLNSSSDDRQTNAESLGRKKSNSLSSPPVLSRPQLDEEIREQSALKFVPGEYLMAPSDDSIFFHASEDSCKDDSVVVLPQRPPAVEYTYFTNAASASSDSSDGGAYSEDDEEETTLSPRHYHRRAVDKRVLGSANRPCCVVLHAMCMGDKITGAMPLLLMASSVRFVAGIATFVYYPILVSRRFPAYENHFSIFNALVVLSCGSFSSFIGGKFGQYVVRRNGLEGLSKFIALTCLFCSPPFAMAFREDRFWFSVVLLALGYLIGEAWMGASMALLQGLSPSRGQGLAMSLYLFMNWNCAAIVTDIIGYMDPGTEDLANLLVIFTAGPLAISFFLFTALAALLHFARRRVLLPLTTNPPVLAVDENHKIGPRRSVPEGIRMMAPNALLLPSQPNDSDSADHRTPVAKKKHHHAAHPFTVR